jgi:hypothetical protein
VKLLHLIDEGLLPALAELIDCGGFNLDALESPATNALSDLRKQALSMIWCRPCLRFTLKYTKHSKYRDAILWGLFKQSIESAYACLKKKRKFSAIEIHAAEVAQSASEYMSHIIFKVNEADAIDHVENFLQCKRNSITVKLYSKLTTCTSGVAIAVYRHAIPSIRTWNMLESDICLELLARLTFLPFCSERSFCEASSFETKSPETIDFTQNSSSTIRQLHDLVVSRVRHADSKFSCGSFPALVESGVDSECFSTCTVASIRCLTSFILRCCEKLYESNTELSKDIQSHYSPGDSFAVDDASNDIFEAIIKCAPTFAYIAYGNVQQHPTTTMTFISSNATQLEALSALTAIATLALIGNRNNCDMYHTFRDMHGPRVAEILMRSASEQTDIIGKMQLAAAASTFLLVLSVTVEIPGRALRNQLSLSSPFISLDEILSIIDPILKVSCVSQDKKFDSMAVHVLISSLLLLTTKYTLVHNSICGVNLEAEEAVYSSSTSSTMPYKKNSRWTLGTIRWTKLMVNLEKICQSCCYPSLS